MSMKKRFVANILIVAGKMKEAVEVAFNTEYEFHLRAKTHCMRLFERSGEHRAELLVNGAMERASEAPTWGVSNWPHVSGQYRAFNDNGLVKIKPKNAGR